MDLSVDTERHSLHFTNPKAEFELHEKPRDANVTFAIKARGRQGRNSYVLEGEGRAQRCN